MAKIKELIKEKIRLSVNLLIGLVLIIYSSMGMIYNLVVKEQGNYSMFFTDVFLELVIFIFGMYLLYDVFKNRGKMNVVDTIIGIFLIFFGLFPILVNLNLLNFLPFNVEFQQNFFLLSLILFVSSIYFLIDAFFGIFRKEYS
jgi:hypothetical protein